MTAFINILLTFTMVFSGIYSQIDFMLNPQKYGGITLDTSSLPEPVKEPEFDGFIDLPQVKMHYRIYGKSGRQPLILVHGNGGSVNSLDEAAQYLANDYTVYLPESRCHGQSSDPGEISYELMASDLNDFIAALGLEKPVIVGHSDGAINAIKTRGNF